MSATAETSGGRFEGRFPQRPRGSSRGRYAIVHRARTGRQTRQGRPDTAIWRVTLHCRGAEPVEGRRAGRHPSAERVQRVAHPAGRCAREHVSAPGAGGRTVEYLAANRTAQFSADLQANIRLQNIALDADDRTRFHSLDLKLHDLFVSAIGYARVRAVVESARLSLDRARRMLITPRRHVLSYREHISIVAAISAGNGSEARDALASHLNSVMEELEDFARKNPSLFSDSSPTTGRLDSPCPVPEPGSRGSAGGWPDSGPIVDRRGIGRTAGCQTGPTA